MVVVSCSWMKSSTNNSNCNNNNNTNNVSVYPDLVDSSIIKHENMSAKAMLICRPNSHQFQDRTLILDQPVKIGRSVARAKPTSNNAIFDCKVLSRHHAVLWYEDGKFFLQDTKSSNGTFVNNTKLSTENHEVCSGDIVQFGVDVVENNRKVTHGCIIASLKLYLPDGKEAKASPSITESDKHGMVPLDELYTLNQILQEANQREQCLESKLIQLQHVVEETKKSAEESWQAYVGEERLLSRVSALETQLQQANKNWSEDRLREEICKLRETSGQYQEAAKVALEKVHEEKLDAVSLAIEQERSKISAEQDALLAKAQLEQAQLELHDVAQKFSELQLKFDESKSEQTQITIELEKRLEDERQKVIKLEAKIHELTLEMLVKLADADEENSEQEPVLILGNDRKSREDILGENDIDNSEIVFNKSNSNGAADHHISLRVVPVDKECRNELNEYVADTKADESVSEIDNKEETKKVTFKLPDDATVIEAQIKNEPEMDISTTLDDNDHKLSSQNINNNNLDDDAMTGNNNRDADDENEDDDNDENDMMMVDSRTLKYQYQSAQNELKRKVEYLETLSINNQLKINELERELSDEKELNSARAMENENLKQELSQTRQKLKENSNENVQLSDKITSLNNQLQETRKQIDSQQDSSSCQQFITNLEEELVLLKERFAQNTEDKMKLQRDLSKTKEQYNVVCNNMYNKLFFYLAPLVLMVLYLLVSAVAS